MSDTPKPLKTPETPSETLEAIAYLRNKLSLLDFELDMLNAEFQKSLDAQIAKNKRSKKKPTKQEMEAWFECALKETDTFKQSVIEELNGAAYLAGKCKIDVPAIRKLAVILEGSDFKLLESLVLDAKVELDRLVETLQQIKPPLTGDELKHQEAINFFIGTDLPWTDITEKVGENRNDWRSFQASVKRFAERTDQPLPLRKPGAKRKK